MSTLGARFRRVGKAAAVAGVVVVSGGSAAWLGMSHARPKSPDHAAPAPAAEPAHDALRVTAANTLFLPADAAKRMGVCTGVVSATHARPLPAFAGRLAVDANALARVHSRFPGEVVSLGTVRDPLQTAGDERPLRVGDAVKKGQLLAVVWSKDLGEKKSELVDALSKLRRDEDVLASLRESSREGAVPARSVRDAERDVESDRVAVERADRTLRSWRLTDDEIRAVRAEADQLSRVTGPRPDAPRPDPAGWARAEVRAPQDGVILEKNLTAGDIVDTAADLFKVGDLSRLAVWAHVYEEDLPLLQNLPTPIPWKVKVPSAGGAEFDGTLDAVGAIIDQNQHTALVSGSVANPTGDLKAGMFVTVTVDAPAPKDEVEVPAEAVVETGRASYVFVRSASDPAVVTRHAVRVVRRFHDVTYLAAGPSGVKPGDTVVTAGALLLNEAMSEQVAAGK